MPSKLELVTFYRFTVTVECYEKWGGGSRGTTQRFPTFGTRSGHQSQQGLRCRWHVKQLTTAYFSTDTLRRFVRHIWCLSIRLRRTKTSELRYKNVGTHTCLFLSRDMREKCLWSVVRLNSENYLFSSWIKSTLKNCLVTYTIGKHAENILNQE